MAEDAGTWKCGSCERLAPVSLGFCPNCGSQRSDVTTDDKASVPAEPQTTAAQTCPFCSTPADADEIFCAACGGKLAAGRPKPASPTLATPITSTATPSNPPHTTESGTWKCGGCDRLVPVSLRFCPGCGRQPSSVAADAQHKRKRTTRRVVGVTVLAGIVIAGIVLWTSAQDGDNSEPVGNAAVQPVDSQPVEESCTSDELRSMGQDFIDLGNSTLSAYDATEQSLSKVKGSRRIKIRFAREQAKAQEITNRCGSVARGLGRPVADLTNADSALYTYYTNYLDTGEDNQETQRRLDVAVEGAVDAFNAAWDAFLKEEGYPPVNQTEDPPVDEATAAD